MATFTYTVRVECKDSAQADEVMAERLLPEEDYGFDYAISFSRVTAAGQQ